METNTGDSKRLLSVLAHPDDESFGMGGTLALYARRGVETHLVCATRGEVGEMDPEYMQGFSSIAERREHELRCAAETLGLAGVHFLDYRDSGMSGSPDNNHPQALAAAPLDEVAARITHYIRKLRPQVVLTFDPIGGYRHPDHIAIHLATVRAFHAAGDAEKYPDPEGLPPYKPARLYYHTISRRFLRVMVSVMPLLRKDPKRWGKNGDIDLTTLAVEDFPVNARIDYTSVMELKRQASLCHASQGGAGLARGLPGWFIRVVGGMKDNFMRAYPELQNARVETDLFAGL